jgi:hypothetical protein
MEELKTWNSENVTAHTSQINNLASTTIEDKAQRRNCLLLITLSGVPVF